MSGKEDVWDIVEAFRARHCAEALGEIPVDVLSIAELKLRLNIIPFDDLFVKYDADAAIAQDLTALYVDAEAYVLWERGPVWKQNRLRFSVAHELGHYELHQKEAKNNRFRSFDDFADWTQTYGGWKYSIEQAANEFAGRLLVPVKRLQELHDGFVELFESRGYPPVEGMRHMFAQKIAPKFGVSAEVIEVRLDREGIWSAG